MASRAGVSSLIDSRNRAVNDVIGRRLLRPVETGLSRTHIGKLLMASTFVTDMGTALALSVLFIKPTAYTALFVAVSLAVIYSQTDTRTAIQQPQTQEQGYRTRDKIHIPHAPDIHVLRQHRRRTGSAARIRPRPPDVKALQRRVRDQTRQKQAQDVAYALITPIFFIVGGLRISLPMIEAAAGFSPHCSS